MKAKDKMSAEAIADDEGDTEHPATTLLRKLVTVCEDYRDSIEEEPETPEVAEARKLLGHGRLPAITPHTVTDPAALVTSLSRVRRQGYATVNEENIRGVLSVAAPIRDSTGRVIAALSVAFPKYLDAGLTLQSATPLVAAAAQRASRAFGSKAA